jgi:hypothetical protein
VTSHDSDIIHFNAKSSSSKLGALPDGKTRRPEVCIHSSPGHSHMATVMSPLSGLLTVGQATLATT